MCEVAGQHGIIVVGNGQLLAKSYNDLFDQGISGKRPADADHSGLVQMPGESFGEPVGTGCRRKNQIVVLQQLFHLRDITGSGVKTVIEQECLFIGRA
ncbi:MAG: hypothetical protein P8Q36_14100 [Alphaproteobacteria bacterium]|nr:hypothetical protein [Rhodospirillaceae bacterium]MBT6509593.1 hypothetical protein [Rhodospirillaceae bacterium]MBT7645476.1 hypothetical protein [Rhodospirillaceae bacterium]MDG2481978.1 hypothetical protein [Alphaproteobacteria bacterium]